MGRLYANDIFLRTVTEFAVDFSEDGAALRELRVWPAPYLVDNVHVESDADGQPRKRIAQLSATARGLVESRGELAALWKEC